MKPAPPDPSADAIHEALSRLDDDDRCLLVEKYFERATLEEIGTREGVSAAAVGKRVDRAKERLKKHLALAGMTAFVPHVDSKLEGARPAAIVPDLISTSQNLESVLTLAGGAVMTAKSVSLAAAASLALLVMLLGAGGGYLVGVERSTPARTPVPPSARADGPANEEGASPDRLGEHPDSAILGTADETSPGANALVSRLDRFKAWHEKNRRDPRDAEKYFRELYQELEGVHDLIWKDSSTFLAWIADPANEACLSALFESEVTMIKRSGKDGQNWGLSLPAFSSLPPNLMDGLLVHLESGGGAVKSAILEFMVHVRKPPERYHRQYLALLSDPNPQVQARAAEVVLAGSDADPTSAEIEAVMKLADTVPDEDARARMYNTLAGVGSTDVRDRLFDALEAGRFQDPQGRLAHRLVGNWLMWVRRPGKAFEERASRLLSSALDRTNDETRYHRILHTALDLDPPYWRPLMDQAAAKGPTPGLRAAAAAVIDKFGSGESGAEGLKAALNSALEALAGK